MGATTWAYPKEFVTRDELIEVISELRGAFAKAYRSFLEKTKSYANIPVVGSKWPVDGYFIPSEVVFFARFNKAASVDTLNILLHNYVTDRKTSN